jgi:hypothetical protein
MRKLLLAGFALTALLAGGNAFGADPRLLNLVMPDATSLAGVNVTTAETTPFGQYVLAQIGASLGPQFQAFISATGFDPRRDVTEILAASSSLKPPSGLVLASGNFPVSQMTTLLAQKAPQATVQTYGGATLIADPKDRSAVAFLGTGIAIAGDVASVKAAIDRSSAMSALSPALSVQVQNLSAAEDAWAVSTVPVSTLIPAAPTGSSPLPAQIASIVSGIQSSSGGVKFGSVVQVNGQLVMKDAATAKSLSDVIQALISMAAMSNGGSGTQNAQTAALVQLLQGVTVSASDAAINIALGIPESQIETFLNGAKNQAAPAARKGVKPAVFAPGARQ